MWHIRKNDGQVFGPVETATLQQWAAEGRVAPDDALSPDGEQWMPAPELGELAMCWRVEFEDGTTYGPLHALALRDPVRDGAISTAARIVHTVSGEALAVADVLLPALLAENERLRDEVAEWAEQAARRKAAPAREAFSGGDPEDVLAAYEELSANYDRMLEQLHGKTVELKAAAEMRADIERDAEERIRQVEKLLRREQEDARKAREQLADIEAQHHRLLKAYREMNDRFIRLRQQRGPAPSSPAGRERDASTAPSPEKKKPLRPA